VALAFLAGAELGPNVSSTDEKVELMRKFVNAIQKCPVSCKVEMSGFHERFQGWLGAGFFFSRVGATEGGAIWRRFPYYH
jgi:hypothetical protein